jgi:hypothetical protein
MNTDTPDTGILNTEEPVWGTPSDAPAHWSTNKTLAAVGIAAALAAGGAAVIHAAGGGSEQAGPGFGGPPGGGPGFGPGGFGAGGPGSGGQGTVADALHGEFVVADGHGGFTTELTQVGEVTDISDTAITARSDDGFTHSYLITTDTRQGRSPVHAGEHATIRAVSRDGSDTATAISPAH